MTKPKTDFSFGDHAPIFDAHIRASIPNYDELVDYSVSLSLNHVQNGTSVVDLGCSRGTFLAHIRKANQLARPNVHYLGIDNEPGFSRFWSFGRAKNIRCEVGDLTAYELKNVGFASSLFTVQFLQPQQKLPLLKRLNESMVEGGALIIAEKTLAATPQLQQELDGLYYDHKRKMGFTAEQILDKQRALRGQMTLWTENELRDNLVLAGFSQLQAFWRGMMFVGILALKQSVNDGAKFAASPWEHQDGIIVFKPTVQDGLQNIVDDTLVVMRDRYNMDSLNALCVTDVQIRVISKMVDK